MNAFVNTFWTTLHLHLAPLLRDLVSIKVSSVIQTLPQKVSIFSLLS